eukprot:CAMPEP_0117031460 /NCGR_PEP_ID=MMETSP0472-20121206/22606_1 /TAXON_ID=693140 ORGANISM="Tiarina fusus, Strain LIS" /NCGR_SAMPLE_ID=MMETSP0472 /ASSEMBLY_ACC=CAM_ASM_000603 /LENGTH=232 /DNA_ID=CAMNT_0004739783 /DNA_START=101 /DNA_END=799 /DNA_ORIENTATION=+
MTNIRRRDQDTLTIPEEEEMGSPGSRRVRFPEKRPTIVRRISRVSTRALSEITAMWGDDQEERERKARIRRDLERLAEGETSEEFDPNGSGLCTLGLADKIGPRAEEKMELREKAWDAVMWNQHDQWEEQHNCDYDQVAKVYSEGAHTLQVQEKAQEEAKKLEAEINDVREDPEVRELLRQSSICSRASTTSRSSMRNSMNSIGSQSSLARTSMSSMSSLSGSFRQTSFRMG